jgi:thiopeptide-type bacteriocin biosynthesis protein
MADEVAPKSLDAVPSGFFAFRTPLLPFDVLARWSEGLAAPTASDDALADALAEDHALLVSRLRALVADPIVREALFVASPSLDDAIDAWLKDPASERAHGVAEILTRYLGRMCARATPFGLFSGCSVAPLGAQTRMTLAPRAEYRRHTRLDTHYLNALCEALQKSPDVRSKMLFYPSSGLFRSAGQLRYAEARIEPNARERSFSLVSVETTPYLEATLERAQRGATPASLAEALVDPGAEVTLEDASAYVDQLIDTQILVSDLAPPVTGAEPIFEIAKTLHAAHEGTAAERLTQVAGALDAMDAEGLGLAQLRYKKIASDLAELPAKTELPRLFQVDLFKPAPGSTFGGAPLRELVRALDVVARMKREAPRADALQRFRESFRERYEGREVPLVEVLDEERGLGFDSGAASSSEPAPLLHDIYLPGGDAPGAALGQRDRWLLQRITEMGSVSEWSLSPEDIASQTAGTLATLPDAFSVVVSLAAPSPEAMGKGDFRLWYHGASGPSGAILLGRFCHGDDGLSRLVKEHLRAEEALRPEAVFAEIVHLPEGRLGNILCRPLLRGYEIPYLGRSGAPADRQIPISDLHVSLVGGRIVLRSAKLDREVIPRLTTAHNFALGALGTYRFLCSLQYQGIDGALGWSWGALESSVRRLPRVSVGRVVLSLAKWNLHKDDLKPLGKEKPADRFRAVQALRAKLEFPRWIGVADGDNVLPVDLDNALHVESMVALVKNRSGTVIQEIYPAPDEMCATGPEGTFVHEIVVPFVRKTTHPAQVFAPRPTGARSFSPGSEWLYAKLYTGTATADRVLSDVVAPLVEETMAEGDADSWFFIRYGDPRWHLRLRFHGDPERLGAKVLPRLTRLTAPFEGDGRIWRVSLDTYEREFERYGGDEGMLLCEQLFWFDSDAVLSIQKDLFGDEAAEARWRLAFRGMHLLLLDLGLDLATRAGLMSGIRASFAAEHNVKGDLEKQFGVKFRKLRTELEWLLNATTAEAIESPLHSSFVALEERSRLSKPAAASLVALEAKGLLHPPLTSIAGSLLHMHANRLLRSEARAQELVLYDFLARLYDSEAARAKATNKRAPEPSPVKIQPVKIQKG